MSRGLGERGAPTFVPPSAAAVAASSVGTCCPLVGPRGHGPGCPRAVPELPPSPAGPPPRVDGCTGGGDRARGCRDAAPQVPPPRGDSGAKHGHRLGSWTGQVPLSPDSPAERQQNPWVTEGRMGTARSSPCSLTGCRSQPFPAHGLTFTFQPWCWQPGRASRSAAGAAA